MITTDLRRQEAADAARDRCVRDGEPQKFNAIYRTLCEKDGIDPDAPSQKAVATVGCPRCNRFFPANELLTADSQGGSGADAIDALGRIDADLADLRGMSPSGSAAHMRRSREERAAAWARDRCVKEAAPQRFARYYEDRLAATT